MYNFGANREERSSSCDSDCYGCGRLNAIHILGGEERRGLQLPRAIFVRCNSHAFDVWSHPGNQSLLKPYCMHACLNFTSFNWIALLLIFHSINILAYNCYIQSLSRKKTCRMSIRDKFGLEKIGKCFHLICTLHFCIEKPTMLSAIVQDSCN